MTRTVASGAAALCFVATSGCATVQSVTGGGTAPLEPPAATHPGTAVEAYKEATAAVREAPDRAAAGYERAIQAAPDYVEALNDYAWLLATTPEARVRNPERALELAKRANDVLAQDAMLRKERDALPVFTTQARMMVVMNTMAAALAALGRFKPPLTPEGANREALRATSAGGGCAVGGNAVSVMAFVVQSARDQNARYATPNTADTVRRAEGLLAMYDAGKAPTGVDQIANITSPTMDRR